MLYRVLKMQKKKKKMQRSTASVSRPLSLKFLQAYKKAHTEFRQWHLEAGMVSDVYKGHQITPNTEADDHLHDSVWYL